MEIYDGASYRINIEGMDSTLIVDSYRGIIKANIVDADDYVIVDYDNKTFYGTMVGNTVDDIGNLVLDISEKTFYGNVVGNLVDPFGNIIVDNSLQAFYGNLIGNLTDDVGTVIVNKDEKIFYGDVVGNIVDELGNTVIDKDLKIFHGNVATADGNTILDVENKTFLGDLTGNIIDYAGNIVYDSMNSILNIDDIEVQNLIKGSIKGNVYSNSGELAYDSLTNSAGFDELIVKRLDVEEITITEPVVGNFVGTFSGNIYNDLGEIILDTNAENIKTNLLSENEGVAYDYLTNTFYGSFSGELLNDVGQFNVLQVGDKMAGTDGSLSIFSDVVIEDNHHSPLSIFVSKDSALPGVIMLGKTRGNIQNSEPVQPGDSLSGIVFGGQSGDTFDSCVPSVLLEVVVPENATVESGKIPGQLNISVANNAGELNKVFSINSEGHLITTIKNLTVIGNTNNTPVNPNTPESWLEIIVNGNKKFIPLYS